MEPQVIYSDYTTRSSKTSFIWTVLNTLKQKSIAIFHLFNRRSADSSESRLDDTSSKGPKFPFKNRRLLPLLLILIIGGGLFIVARNWPAGSSPKVLSGDETRVELPGPKATQSINRQFDFPLRNDKGVEVSKLKYIIENVELRDQIVVQGRKATSVKGRTFLIVNLKLVNDFDQSIEINTQDYLRLLVNNKEDEPLAPDIHNDPVKVQAISTKFTRVGFPIDENNQGLKLRVGEINGEKQIIDLNFSGQ